MAEYTQETRPLRVQLGEVNADEVLLTGFAGSESISRLFSFELTVAAPVAAPLKFEDALGKPANVSIDQGAVGHESRHVSGIINRIAQGARDERFIYYRMEMVPHLWLLTKTVRSRLFQQLTTKEILEAVLGPIYSPDFRLEGKYHPRNLCAQYRESDFDFAARLMEEEGMYFYFVHGDEPGMVISDNPRGHDPIADPVELSFQDDSNDTPTEGRVTSWEKAQELQTGAVDLTDHWFEMPTNNLQAVGFEVDKVKTGTVEHPLALGGMDKTAIVEHPGGFAHWRDGIDPGGAERPADLDPLFEDNARIAGVRADQEATRTVRIQAAGTYCRLTPGHKFKLSEHFDADGEYVLTEVTHAANCGIADTGGPGDYDYENSFECLPFVLPFRPARETPRPVVKGTQTAVVVGPPDEEIFPDKYGRVKVWFRWDPEGPRGLDSSCWVRVAQSWAGTQWGFQQLPRIGQEVIVDFLEGDPDQPIIIGSVYNNDLMPTYDLPANKTVSGIKTRSSPGGTANNYNELKFEDKKGQELVSIHAEKDMSITVEDNYTVSIGGEQKDPRKAGKSSSTTFGDTSYTVSKGDYKFSVDAGKGDWFVKGPVVEIFDNTQTTTVTNSIDISSKTSFVHVTSPTEILLTVGSSTLRMTPDSIVLTASKIHFEGKAKISGNAPDIVFTGGSNVSISAPEVIVEGKSTVDIMAPTLTTSGKSEATHHGGTVTVVGDSTATQTVGPSSVVCEAGGVKVAAPTAKVTGDTGVTVTGATIKLN